MTADAGLPARVFGEPVETDERILDGALEALLDFGVKRTSMGEIARRAKVSPATLYRKFPSKNAVIEAVGLREARRFVEAADACVDKSTSGADQVVDCFVGFARTFTGNPLLKRLIDTEPESMLPHLTIRGGPILAVGRRYLSAFLLRLQSEGKVPEFDADEVGEMCARLALSFALTPDGVIKIDDEASARRYAATHITALMRLPPPAADT